ncbi:MAG: hypothetical protein J6S21_00230, partial [Victivallales bacterium]|nr:hypothetical protein [Victivallales bacterium]
FMLPSKTQKISPADHNSPRLILKSMKDLLSMPRFWLFLAAMFLTGGAEHCLNFWMPTYVQGHFAGSGIVGSIGPVVFALGMASGRMTAGIFGNPGKLRQLMMGGVIIAFCAALASQIAPSLWWFYALVALMGFSSGPVWPSLLGLSAATINHDRTIMFILMPCVGIPGCGFFPWLMGTVADLAGLQRSFLLLPLCFLLLLVILAILKDRR